MLRSGAALAAGLVTVDVLLARVEALPVEAAHREAVRRRIQALDRRGTAS